MKRQPSLDRLSKDAQKLVKVIRHSNLLTEKVEQLQKMEADAELPLSVDAEPELEADVERGSAQSLRLILNVVPRFNSLCMLFARLYKLRSVTSKLCTDEKAALKGFCITSEQWIEMGELLEVLEPSRRCATDSSPAASHHSASSFLSSPN